MFPEQEAASYRLRDVVVFCAIAAMMTVAFMLGIVGLCQWDGL